MRKFLLFALVATMFAACATDGLNDSSATIGDFAPETLTVSFEDDDSRIQLNETGKTVWTKGDLVSVFYLSNANQKWQYQGNTGERTGNLRRVANAEATQEISSVVVVYPYSENYYINPRTCNVKAFMPAVQKYLKDSYGLNGNIMISQSEYNQFSLKNVCGWLKVQLKGNGEVVKTITLKGNNGEQVAGEIYINSADATATLAAEMGGADDTENSAGGNLVFDDTILTEVALNCNEGVTLGAEPTSFYIALPPQTFKDGVTIEILTADNAKMVKSTSNAITISRNTIQPMATLNCTFEDPISSSEIWYTSINNSVVAPYNVEAFGVAIESNTCENGVGIIKFANEVTAIGAQAFYNCANLCSVILPNSVTSIGNEAFYGTSLSSLEANCIETIGDRAFAYCASLTSAYISDSITEVGKEAFGWCPQMKSFDSMYASSDKRCLVIESELKAFAPAGIVEYVIPNSVTSIANGAFSGADSLESVTIPYGVLSIGANAFSTCTSLVSFYCKPTTPPAVSSTTFKTSGLTIYVSASAVSAYRMGVGWSTYLSQIVGYDFEKGEVVGNNTISKIWYTSSDDKVVKPYNSKVFGANVVSNTYEDGVGVIAFDGLVSSIGNEAFMNCTTLTSITICNSAISIGDYAFSGCTKLKSVTIPDSITGLGAYAFQDCGKLTGISLPNTIVHIKEGAFMNCTSLTSLTLPKNIITIPARMACDCSSLSSIVIPSGVTTIEMSAFGDCENLASVSIPSSVSSIEASAFGGLCYNLTSVHITDLDAWCRISFGQNANPLINAGVLYLNGEVVRSVTIPADMVAVKDYVFQGCTCLTSVNMHDNITSIGDYAFANCSGVKELNLPANLTTIGTHAFDGWSSLTNLTIPDKVTKINPNAFENCSNITSVSIGSKVKTIGMCAFYNCTSLMKIYVNRATPASGGTSMFTNNAAGRKIYVPVDSVDTYKEATYWSDYKSYIVGYEF